MANKNEKGEEMTQLQRELKELRLEVKLAIETAANVSHRLMTAKEVCKAMGISAKTLLRYEKLFEIPVRRMGRKKFYFEAEVKNSILAGFRWWKE
ncbi:MerR family transcriptional regulator [Butyricimonas synergistica]|uniref:MerR family transcriptional regulator n=1 Tax=Butyricimonas synergistica TaxID=544644 RepID=UPI0003782DC3|nr:MerR family transcriptional regulator [Butyricimonas synergistica]